MSSSVMPFASLGERDSDGEPLPSSNAVSRRIHLPPNNTSSLEDGRVSLGGQNVQRKESRSGLRGIFSRNKSEKNAVSIVPEENQPTSPLTSLTPLSPKLTSPITSTVGDGFFRKFATSNATDSSSPATSAAPVRATKTPSRLNLRSNPVKDRKAASKPEPKTSPNTSVFDPPPLFQSYSQSMKHARLSASTLSADAIIRMSNHKRDTRLRDEIAQTTATGLDQGKEDGKTTTNHKRQKSGSISNSDWTEKIFVLVSSGYLLQYTGEGNFDRLPEKMVQLGKESVAFASDVIPGKHWVLQVSQSMNPDGVPTSDSRSLLSRLAFRSPDYRRNATSLLLVLDSAEEMDSWIAVLRKEIEKLGGKKQTTETGTVKTEEKMPEFKIQPSHRYPIRRRGSDQVSNPCSPLQRPCDRRTSREEERQTNKVLALPSSSSDENRRSWHKPEENSIKEPPPSGYLPPWSLNEAQNETAARPLTGCASVTNSASSYEHNLEGLRDSLNRFSYCSSTQRTRISSEATSPARDSTPTMEDPPHLSLETVRARPNAAEIVERRRSLQAIPGLLDPIPKKSSSRLQTSQQTLRHSSYGAASRPIRSPSPATTNFSVPVPSSKRFLTRSLVAERRPSLPALNTTMETQNRSKKGPPAALPVARFLSPVFDTTSPKRILMPATSVETPHRPVLQNKLSANDIQLGSPEILPVRTGTLTRSRRVTNFLALDDALDVQNTDVRRHSSMQEARQILPPMKSNESSKVPEPLLPKMSHDETFDNIRGNEWGSLPKLQESSIQAQPLPTLSEIPPKQSSLRRPRSMLVSSSLQSHATEEMSNTPRHKRPSSTLVPTTIPLTFDDEKASHNLALSIRSVQSGRGVSNRRSIQAFMYGAPLSPPPNYALPPLPPGYASKKSSGPSFVTSREEIGARI
ncbi:hypothetical protein DSL72_005624 [Monilinia vaccinii-corymbosi]|uniref:PH domain-containing protein n=1 Tax=Monilinia vaccinii-corymbosi TaxID=61207 RepID=A0A8A3PG77_9HELO|nr:hypothetical protein DSL72_005624 [Monilinia vaccinii-corymbosi]